MSGLTWCGAVVADAAGLAELFGAAGLAAPTGLANFLPGASFLTLADRDGQDIAGFLFSFAMLQAPAR
jgi:hypothetical protein